MQVTLARDGTLGPPASKPEIVLYKAPRAKILWPVEVLGHEGDFVRILSFDRKRRRSSSRQHHSLKHIKYLIPNTSKE